MGERQAPVIAARVRQVVHHTPSDKSIKSPTLRAFGECAETYIATSMNSPNAPPILRFRRYVAEGCIVSCPLPGPRHKRPRDGNRRQKHVRALAAPGGDGQ